MNDVHDGLAQTPAPAGDSSLATAAAGRTVSQAAQAIRTDTCDSRRQEKTL